MRVRITLGDTIVYEGEHRIDGGLDALVVDLSPFAGNEGVLTLRVIPQQGAVSRGIYWIEPRIEEPA